MKSARTLIVVSFVFVLLCFQNCIGKSTAAASESNQPTTTKVEKFAVAGKDLRKVLYRVSAIRNIKTETHEYSLKTALNYEVDMQSLQVRQSWDDDGERINPGEPYCLEKSLVEKIAKIIVDSQLCRTEIYRSNLACTQVVRPAFAEITTNNDKFKLTSGSDPCSTTAENVCGDGAKAFREILLKIDWQNNLKRCRK